MAVSAAAFRVAGLALENIIRHAPGASAGIEVRAAADQVRLIVTDDGPGMESMAYPLATGDGRRGLADMVAEASACGASVDVTARSGGHGTTVAFRWPAT
jgi:signal transduction histidine kinase